jgi:DNA-binding transcriptional LysR family regulator
LRDASAKSHKVIMFEWNDLRYFLTVARAASTTAAAKILGVNQSTVQRRLAALEERIGRKLIDRDPTGCRLTEIGEELLPYAVGVEQAVTAFERRLASIGHSLTGVVRVTCPDGLVTPLMTPLINDFYKHYPSIRIDLIVSERFLDLAKGEADIAVRGGVPGSDVLFGRKIAESPWAVYASRSYIERHGRPERPEDINRHAIIDFDSANAHIHHLSNWLRTVAPQAKVAARSETVIGLMMAVKSGAGLTILPMPMADAQADLVRVIEPLPELQSPIYLLMHPDLRNTLRIRAFFDFVVTEIDSYRSILLGETRQVPQSESPM